MSPVDDFMRRVVAWPGVGTLGYVNLHWQTPDHNGLHGRPFTTLPEFMDFVQRASGLERYKEIYFCLSTQRDTGKEFRPGYWAAKRSKDLATAVKSLWVDADFGPTKPYKTLVEVLRALAKFCQDANLPPPTAIVLTGGGVHAYWISNRPLTPDEWRPLAEGLKAEAIRLGFHCDPISADAARILRVPGTFNNKTDTRRIVELKYLADDDYDFSAPEFVALAAKAPAVASASPVTVTAPVTVTFKVPSTFAAGPSKVFAGLDPNADNLGAGIGRSDALLDKGEVFRGCAHFQDSFLTHGKSQSQGLWMLTGLACTWLDGGRDVFHALSRDYPSYTPAETDKMFDRKLDDRTQHKLGWPLCKTLEGEGAKCQQCSFYGKLKSPLNLAERVAPIVTILPPPPPELNLPDDYTVDKHGLICEIVEKTNSKGVTTTYPVNLFLKKLRNFSVQGGHSIRFSFEVLLDAGGEWGAVSINQATDLVNETTLCKVLWAQKVVPHPDNVKRIIKFMATFIAKLDAMREREATTSFGWLHKEGGEKIGFAFNGLVFMNDGSERVASGVDDKLSNFYRVAGEQNNWMELLNVITKQNHPALEVIVASSFAAPLVAMTGHYNAMVATWSRESGAHKSTSMAAAAAVWGSPKHTKEKPDSSPKGIRHKLDALKNLPMYWDEISSPEKLKEVRGMLGGLTEGASGAKLTSGREFHKADEWQTLMLLGSNLSLVDSILDDSATSTDAQLQRVFEFEVEKRPDTEKARVVDQLVSALDSNHGHMGEKYSKLLGTNVERVHRLVQGALHRLDTEVQTKSEERFHCAVVAVIYVGACLGNEVGCNFHYEDIWEFMKTEFLRLRNKRIGGNAIAGTADNVAQQFNLFLKDHGSNTGWIARVLPLGPGRPTGIIMDGLDPMRRGPVHIRMAVHDRLISFSVAALRSWMKQQGAEPSAVLQGLVKHFGAKEAGIINLAAGTGVPGARERTMDIPVSAGSPFESALLTHCPPDVQMAAPNVVTASVTPIRPKVP